ncbi:MAG: NAD(P)H-dependent oxidoreductase [Sulfurovaceae bacterium]|nr:NAD(P)H-dependent oxidoreductase [Sulfurovaceae bacterium]
MQDISQLLEVLHFRHACKLFDNDKKISKENLNFILESARLAPSSFGMEHWRFIVIKNQELKKILKPFCWDQAQITTCDALIAIVAKHKLVSTPSYYEAMFARKGIDADATQAYIKKYANYIHVLPSIKAWSEKQCYIAASNIMNYSAMIGIDSCPIEGFERENVEKVLGIDDSKESMPLFVALGYRTNLQTPKHRLPLDEIVEIVE